MKKVFVFLLIVTCSFPVFANENNNAELERLFNEDQESQRSQSNDWDALDREEAARRDAVLALLKKGEVETGLDYFHAAVIFQHSESVEDIRRAHALATISETLGYSRATWLMAASWDRLMMYFEQPQWYGTQFTTDESGDWKLYDVNVDIISDEQRAEWNVPSLEASKERASRRN